MRGLGLMNTDTKSSKDVISLTQHYIEGMPAGKTSLVAQTK